MEVYFLHLLYNFFRFHPLLIKNQYYLKIFHQCIFLRLFPLEKTFDIIVLLQTVITNFALYDMKLLAMGRGYEIKEKAALAYEDMNLIIITEEKEGEGRGKAKRRGKEEQKTIERTETKQEPTEKSEVKLGHETQSEAQPIKETDFDPKEPVKSSTKKTQTAKDKPKFTEKQTDNYS